MLKFLPKSLWRFLWPVHLMTIKISLLHVWVLEAKTEINNLVSQWCLQQPDFQVLVNVVVWIDELLLPYHQGYPSKSIYHEQFVSLTFHSPGQVKFLLQVFFSPLSLPVPLIQPLAIPITLTLTPLVSLLWLKTGELEFMGTLLSDVSGQRNSRYFIRRASRWKVTEGL